MGLTLLYHDIVSGGQFDHSGFPGADAAVYKIDVADFQRHVATIAKCVARPADTVFNLLPRMKNRPRLPHLGLNADFMVTFDDGGVSAYTLAKDILGRQGWRSHFFVTTDNIDAPSFLSTAQLLALRQLGHIIGSHSCSHPLKMSSLTPGQMLFEWRRSKQVLEEILGEPVTTASIPGGAYSREVAQAAAEAGYTVLFTSEPRTGIDDVEGCTVLGRYTLQRGMSHQTAARMAIGETLPRARQWAYWNTKKLAKRFAGDSYTWLRLQVLDRQQWWSQ